MRGRSTYKKNEHSPDYLYNRIDVGRFINYLMAGGKKTAAEKAFYGAMDEVKKVLKEEDPVKVFERAMANASPLLETVSRRVGGANYQVPREVRGERKLSLAFRWIIGGARAKAGTPMSKRLAEEIMLAAKNEGIAVKKKTDMHRMADANKAFAHFAW